ncbi:MAG: glycoside hydrolase family 15 protein [Acidisphaera sp.]|nr:glycoside hydrolase family 15 protein [Acidisphaera sp.]MBV9813146.1 glycoside hydrolase family 15 protein [Acetobacteraceae bacterium]
MFFPKNAPPSGIADYGLIGDCLTAALVSRNGSIDWLCWPRFDGEACFSALLGTSEHGRWIVAPRDRNARTRRCYRGGSVVLETVFSTAEGEVALIDFMPVGTRYSSVVRIVEGRRGAVPMETEVVLRFSYGADIPWVTQLPTRDGISAIAGPNRAVLRARVDLRGSDFRTVASFTVREGERVPFVLTYSPSHLAPPKPIDPMRALTETERFWNGWSGRCGYKGAYVDPVRRSLVTLKAMTYAPTGGIVAAPTTSLPEQLGGPRNWDYRFCWLRDATITLLAFMHAGYFDEAQAWREWLLRSVAGAPDQLRIMYGIAGERRLTEWDVDWLPGYRGSKPVRIGNAAHEQVQLDVYGEMMDALHQARAGGIVAAEDAWRLQTAIVEDLAKIWDKPDEGIWEVRGGSRQFTHSKVMAWVALDRSIRTAEDFRVEAPLERWRALRDEMHRTVCAQGFDAELGAFVQSFGSKDLDAACLLIPLVGFLPADDPRVRGTITAIERDLMLDGLVRRYRTEGGADGLSGDEGVFLACSFWLAENYAMQGRTDDAHRLFERLLSLRNDLGLLAEEYDPVGKQQLGNFPQAFSHVALVGCAFALSPAHPAFSEVRAESDD